KLPAEIAALRRAAQMADDAYAVFRDAVKPGRRQYEVVADIEAYLRRRGCPDNFMIIGSGGKDVFGMTPPSERRIASGDLVTTELTPAVTGYFAQICRTLVVGKATDAQRRAFDVFREALAAGIAAVRPGATASDVARAENDGFRKYGLGGGTTQQMDARARPRPRSVLRLEAAPARGCRYAARTGHGLDRASQHLSSQSRLRRARRRRGGDGNRCRGVVQDAARTIRGRGMRRA